jgi:hypothetical protein
MKNLILSALILLAPLGCRAVDVTPLDVKPGLWEATVTMQVAGMAGIPPDVLARMSPEQRARIEAAMNTPHTSQVCYTSESFKKPLEFGDRPNASCKRSVTASSVGELDFHVECDNGKTKSSGDGHIQAAGRESIKGEVVMNNTASDGRTTTGKITFSSRWLSSDCGTVKPR